MVTGTASAPTSLLDVLPQAAGSTSTWATIGFSLTGPLAELTRRSGVALAAWLLVLDRLRGDPRVGLAIDGGWLEMTVPAEGTVAEWAERVRAASASALGAPTTDPELSWASSFGDEPAADASTGLWLTVGLSADGAHLMARYRSPLLAPTVVETLLLTWRDVLSQFANDGSLPLSKVSVVSAAERERLLVGLNAAAWSHTGPMSVTACFRAVAQRHAERAAVAWSDGHLSYAELDERSYRLAAALHEAGVRPGEVVAVAIPRSARSIVAILGVLRAGAAYLPVDPAYPAERLRFMFADASVRVLIVGNVAAPAVPAGVQCIDVDKVPSSDVVILPEPDGEALAYVMYTSGSTGTPKGVEICHRSIVRLVCGADFMNLHDGVVMLHAAPLGFDASTLEIWGPLLNGGTCVLHAEDVPTGAGLAAAIRQHRVEAAWLTAALFNAVVDDDPRQLSGLRELLIGGEAL
jgi:non-ribosomal peptide synthetase component F